MLAVAGDVAGDSSLFRLLLVLGIGGAAIGSKPPGCFLRWERCFSSMLNKPSFVKGFGSTSFMPVIGQSHRSILPLDYELTMLKVHRNVIAPYVRSHSDDRGVVKLSNKVCRRHSIEIRHDDVHEN